MDESSQLRARIEQAREREEQLRRNRERESIARIFADPEMVRFKIGPDEVIRHLGGTVDFDADGQPLNAGKPLAERLRDFAAVNPQAIAGSISETHDGGESSIRAKSDFKSDKEKSEYISKVGLAAFAKLPATRPETREIPVSELTWEQYKALPLRERAKIAGEQGSEFIARLHHVAGEQARNERLAGKPRN